MYLPFDATTSFLGIYSADEPTYKYNDLWQSYLLQYRL